MFRVAVPTPWEDASAAETGTGSGAVSRPLAAEPPPTSHLVTLASDDDLVQARHFSRAREAPVLVPPALPRPAAGSLLWSTARRRPVARGATGRDEQGSCFPSVGQFSE